MSAGTICDNCGTHILDSNKEGVVDWIVVGWKETGMEDACSIKCARSLLNQMAQRLRQWQREYEAS